MERAGSRDQLLLNLILSNHRLVSYRFPDKLERRMNNAFSYPGLFNAPAQWVSVVILQPRLGEGQKTRIMVISDGVNSLKIYAFLRTQYHNVTDTERDTDRNVVLTHDNKQQLS